MGITQQNNINIGYYNFKQVKIPIFTKKVVPYVLCNSQCIEQYKYSDKIFFFRCNNDESNLSAELNLGLDSVLTTPTPPPTTGTNTPIHSFNNNEQNKVLVFNKQYFLSHLEICSKRRNKGNFTSKSNSNKIKLFGVGGNIILFKIRFLFLGLFTISK